MAGHEVLPVLTGLKSKLATRSRHVCAFLGAGASRACGLPHMVALNEQVMERLDEQAQRALKRVSGGGRNIEQVLSRLRRIATLLGEGSDQVDGLTAAEAHDLDRAICAQIVHALDVDEADPAPMLYFASWLARADYHLPVEVFTVNYDLGLETALESLGVPYFDGFVGSLKARFRTELVEASERDKDDWLPSFLVRLWKLHGSVNWQWDSGPSADITRLGAAVDSDSLAAIYPSDTKYDESRRVPFVVLQDRFRRALNQPETLVLMSGYSFGDDHLNEMIFDAARRRPRSEFSVFCFRDIPESLSKIAMMTPNLQALGRREAILGGIRADWQAPEAEDALEGIWNPQTDQGDAGLVLGDFGCLARYLARSSPPMGEHEARLSELLDEGR